MLHRIFFQFLAFLKGRFFPEIVRLSGRHEMKLNFFFRDKELEKLNKMSVWECCMHLFTLIQMLTHFFTVCSC